MKSTILLAVCFTCIVLVLDFGLASNAVNIHQEYFKRPLFEASDNGVLDSALLYGSVSQNLWLKANYTENQVATLADAFQRYYQNVTKTALNITSSYSQRLELGFDGNFWSVWNLTIFEEGIIVVRNEIVFWLFVVLNAVVIITDLIIIWEILRNMGAV